MYKFVGAAVIVQTPIPKCLFWVNFNLNVKLHAMGNRIRIEEWNFWYFNLKERILKASRWNFSCFFFSMGSYLLRTYRCRSVDGEMYKESRVSCALVRTCILFWLHFQNVMWVSRLKWYFQIYTFRNCFDIRWRFIRC